MREPPHASRSALALAKGRQRSEVVRVKRRELRQGLKAGEIDPWALVDGRLDKEWGEWIRPLTIRKLLLMQHGIGEAKCQEILEIFRASPLLKVGALIPTRRAQLALIAQEVLGQLVLPPLDVD